MFIGVFTLFEHSEIYSLNVMGAIKGNTLEVNWSIQSKEVNFIPYQPVSSEFTVLVPRPIKKCCCFISI